MKSSKIYGKYQERLALLYFFSKYTKAEVVLLEGVSHMGVVVGEEIHPVIKEWLESFN